MSVDPNQGPTSSSLRNAFDAFLSDVLDLPLPFTQWIYAAIADPTRTPRVAGVAGIAAPQTQSFTDTGHIDFYSQGSWVVEVATGSSVIGGAWVTCGTQTGSTNRTVTVAASGANNAGTTPTFAAVNNNSASAVFRVSTAAGSGAIVTVTYRRSTVTS